MTTPEREPLTRRPSYTSKTGNKKTIDLNYVAAVYIPDGWPKPEDPKLAFVAAVHYEANLLQLTAAQIAKFFRIPVLYHGELPKDWKGLGFEARSEIYAVGPGNVSRHNPCEPLDIKRGMLLWGALVGAALDGTAGPGKGEQ